MATLKFTKKEISDILNSEYKNEIEKLKTELKKYHVYFSSGAECNSISQFINWLSDTEGNYFDLDNEIKSQLKSFKIL